MNTNEVISNRAIEMTGGDRFHAKKSIHPNDHVNMGQSTFNDMFPTAIHVAVGQIIAKNLIPALQRFQKVLDGKAKEWDDIIKVGRTHLADATPIRLGQAVSGFARQAELSVGRGNRPQGHPRTPRWRPPDRHRHQHAPAIRQARRRGIGQGNRRPFVGPPTTSRATPIAMASSNAPANSAPIAVSLFSIANNIRWLGSGPRCGFYEVILPDRQPGSSIMPGKVNPVMSESMMQVCARVIGNDQTVAFSGATDGRFRATS